LLHTVQSNVSARIRKLERHFGQSLFVRLHRGVSPTAAARSLYPEAKNLISRLSR
jgi:DNA-binding transcriptional LysR family regulator